MRYRVSCLLFASSFALIGCTSLHASRTSTLEESPQPQLVADATQGEALYTKRCASCHGATGREGGFGPSLAHEDRRMDDAFVIAWIEKPNPPMSQLYPIFISKQDVVNIAAYVESL
jgi:mono/diheme cytochrome c family protein